MDFITKYLIKICISHSGFNLDKLVKILALKLDNSVYVICIKIYVICVKKRDPKIYYYIK